MPFNESSALTQRIQKVKSAYFKTSNIEIKSRWIRMPNLREEKYLLPYGLTNEDLAVFVGDIYNLMIESRITIFAGVVDKHRTLQKNHSRGAWHPLTIAYEILMQRVVLTIPRTHTVQVYMDNMSGKTSSGNEHNTNLLRHHRVLQKYGSRLLPKQYSSLSFGCLQGDLKFIDSARSDLVQLADLIAYNVYRQFVEHGDSSLGVDDLSTDDKYEWFQKLWNKFDRSWRGSVQGYGVAVYPSV